MLGIMTAGQIIAAAMNKSLRDDIATAFEPIAMVATASLIIVARPEFPARNARELIARPRRTGQDLVASPGFGAMQHVGELFLQTPESRRRMCRSALARGDLAPPSASRSTCCSTPCSRALGQAESGQLKAIAVTGNDRSRSVPDVPPAIEFACAGQRLTSRRVRARCNLPSRRKLNKALKRGDP